MGKRTAYPGVEARGNSLRIVFHYAGRRCRESLGIPATAPNLRHAAFLRAQIVDRIRLGTFTYRDYFPDSPLAASADPKALPTFGEMADRWLKVNPSLQRATREEYVRVLGALLAPLRDKPIQHITFDELVDLLGNHPWKSMKSRNNALTPIRGPFALALESGVISTNPALRLKTAKFQKEEPDPLTIDEANRLIAWLATHRTPAIHAYFEFALFSGLRTSELIALQWADIDFNLRLVRVRQAMVRGEVKSTKTYQVRNVELNSRALAALSRQRAVTSLAGQHVFLDPLTGQPFIDHRPPRLHWHAALKGLGIRGRNPYQTRHTYATTALMAGANVAWVSRQLGHKSVKTTLDVYARWIDLADRGRELAKVEAALAGANGAVDGAALGISGVHRG